MFFFVIDFSKTYDAYDLDLAQVQFFFKTSTIIEFESNPSLTWVTFFSNIGGLLGLCIGLSIVTVVELFWLGLKIVANLVKPRSVNHKN